MDRKEIWIATSNKEKLEEYKKMLPSYEVKSLLDLPKSVEIVEDGRTFEDNAIIKAKQLASYINKPAIGDDSGINIISMNNWPGVYSKRWAYPTTDYQEINEKLLKVLKQRKIITKDERKAEMVTAIAYYEPDTGEQYVFRGTIDGYITNKPRGEKVFGYDQVFEVEGTGKTFSELGEQKNEFSHRRRALNKLFLFMNEY